MKMAAGLEYACEKARNSNLVLAAVQLSKNGRRKAQRQVPAGFFGATFCPLAAPAACRRARSTPDDRNRTDRRRATDLASPSGSRRVRRPGLAAMSVLSGTPVRFTTSHSVICSAIPPCTVGVDAGSTGSPGAAATCPGPPAHCPSGLDEIGLTHRAQAELALAAGKCRPVGFGGSGRFRIGREGHIVQAHIGRARADRGREQANRRDTLHDSPGSMICRALHHFSPVSLNPLTFHMHRVRRRTSSFCASTVARINISFRPQRTKPQGRKLRPLERTPRHRTAAELPAPPESGASVRPAWISGPVTRTAMNQETPSEKKYIDRKASRLTPDDDATLDHVADPVGNERAGHDKHEIDNKQLHSSISSGTGIAAGGIFHNFDSPRNDNPGRRARQQDSHTRPQRSQLSRI